MAGDLEAAEEALIRRMRLIDEYLECHKRIATVLKEVRLPRARRESCAHAMSGVL